MLREDTEEAAQLKSAEGTVLLHIFFAVKQNQELGRIFIKYIRVCWLIIWYISNSFLNEIACFLSFINYLDVCWRVGKKIWKISRRFPQSEDF